MPIFSTLKTESTITVLTLLGLVSLPVASNVQTDSLAALQPSYVRQSPSGSLSLSTIEVFEREASRWEFYLRSITRPIGVFSVEHIDHVRRLWNQILERNDLRFPLPLSQPTNDGGGIQLAWDNGSQYIDVEITPEGLFHWYFRDRATGEVLGTLDQPVDVLENAFFDKLPAFAQVA
jgi:hypothetical protein